MTRPQPTSDAVVAHARAVADPTRVAILRHLRSAGRALSVSTLADAFGLHPNAVRQHLAVLADADLVTATRSPAPTGGRPSLVYEAADLTDDLEAASPYEALAALLAEVAAGAPAREVGRRSGRAAALAANASGSAGALDRLEAVLVRQGFAPRREASGDAVELVLTACPYSSAVTASSIVCDLHLGAAEGLVAGSGLAVTALVPAPPDRDGCRLRVDFNQEVKHHG